MKRLRFASSLPHLAMSAAALSALCTALFTEAASLQSARITHVVKDVTLLSHSGNSKPADLSSTVLAGTTVKTGVGSRVELTYPDQTLARLGSQTICNTEARAFDLGGGTLFLHVPEGVGSTEIRTTLVSVSTSGGTVVLETFNFPNELGHVDSSEIKSDARYKLTVLSGEAKLCQTHSSKEMVSECITVARGETLLGNATGPQGSIVAFNVEGWMANNSLVADFGPLSSAILAAIGSTSSSQGAILALLRGVDAGSLNSAGSGTINPSNVGAVPDTSANEAQETICHNRTTLVLPRKAAEKHLARHASDSRGACR